MKFRSTRGLEKGIASANAIINGISKDGGLYVPDEFPKIYEDLKTNTSIKYEKRRQRFPRISDVCELNRALEIFPRFYCHTYEGLQGLKGYRSMLRGLYRRSPASPRPGMM